MSAADRDVDAVIDEILAAVANDERDWAETVQPGDWVDAADDRHFTFSQHQYCTKDKLYQVKAVDIRADESGRVYCRTVLVDSDFTDPNGDGRPERMWLGPSRVIVRDGVVIWQSTHMKAVDYLLANRHLKPDATPEDWATLEAMQYRPEPPAS